MRRFENCLTGMLYEVKRQHPLFTQIEKGMLDVERELNKGKIIKEQVGNHEQNR